MKIYLPKGKMRAGLCAATILTAASFGTVAVAERPPEPPPSPGAANGEATTPPPAPRKVSSSVAQRFGVFRREQEASDRVSVNPGWARATGMNPDLARRINASGPPVHAIPGRGVVCVVDATQSGSCTPDEFVGKDFLIATCGDLPSGRFEVSGLVPDTVANATLRGVGGASVPAEVEENFLTAQIDDTPAAVVWETGGGQDVEVPLPRIEPDRCD